MAGAVRAVLVDLSGTLHVGATPTPGAVQALRRLRTLGVAVRFVTNTSKDGSQKLLQRLNDIGFDVRREEVYSALSAGRQLVAERCLRPLCLLTPSAREDFAGVEQTEPNAVLVGLAPEEFCYSRLNEAFALLLRGAPLIALHAGRYYRGDGARGLCLGPGAFVRGLEYSAGVIAEVVGKPERAFFLGALSGLGVRPEEAVMVGDDVRDDVYGAMACGMRGVLVRTGKYREGDERTPRHATAGSEDCAGGANPTSDASTGGATPTPAASVAGPTATCATFADAVQWLVEHCELRP